MANIESEARAWLDLSARPDVVSSDIKKHRNDIIRIVSEMVLEECVLSDEIRADMETFIEGFDVTEAELKSLRIRGTKPEIVKETLRSIYLSDR